MNENPTEQALSQPSCAHPTPTKQSKRGSVIIEMLVGFPLLLIMILSIVQFGHMMMVRNVTSSAAREATRIAILPSSVAKYGTEDFNDIIENAIENILTDAGITNYTYEVNLKDVGGESGFQVEVTVNYKTVAIIPEFFGSYGDGIDFKGSVTMRQETF